MVKIAEMCIKSDICHDDEDDEFDGEFDEVGRTRYRKMPQRGKKKLQTKLGLRLDESSMFMRDSLGRTCGVEIASMRQKGFLVATYK